jgi:GntR family transcriptional repressor for pyruvate dehydrogenase complex
MQSHSRSQQITAELRDEILRGRFRSGERLPSERDLAERFGVNRGSVREALKKLEQLGLTDIQPGGARVTPIEEASLDVIEYLLELDDPPDPMLVDQVLEVFSGLFGITVRLGTERANDEQREAILTAIEVLADPALGHADYFERFHSIGDLFLDAAGNMVLKLVRRGLHTHLLDSIGPPPAIDVSPPAALRVPPLRLLAGAVRESDGSAAADAVHELTVAMRGHIAATLSAAHAATAKGGGT